MSAVKPVNIVTPKAMAVFTSLDKGDRLLMLRQERICALELDSYLEAVGAAQEAFYDLSLKMTQCWPSYTPHPPTVVTVGMMERIELPEVIHTHAQAPKAVVDFRDIATTVSIDALAYVKALEVKAVTLDPREQYIDWASMPVKPVLREEPKPPLLSPEHRLFQDYYVQYASDYQQWLAEKKAYELALGQYAYQLKDWLAVNDIERIVPDGTHRQSTPQVRVLERSWVKTNQDLELNLEGTTDTLLGLALAAIQTLNEKVSTLQMQVDQLTMKVRTL